MKKIIIIFIILFIILEISFRVFLHLHFIRHPLPFKETEIKGVPYVDAQLEFEKISLDKKRPRIVILGDYISMHRGQNNKTYPELLDEKLNRSFEVINTSATFYSLPQEMALLKNKALYYKPDIIIIGYVFNDLYLENPMHVIIPLKLKKNIYEFKPIIPLAIKYFRILNKRKYYSKAYERGPQIIRYFANLHKDVKLRQLLKQSLSELSLIKKEKGIEMIFVIFPAFYDFNNKDLNYINDFVYNECLSCGLTCINLLEIFKKYELMQVKENDGDIWHQSSFANNLIANEIYNRIRASGK